MTVKKGRTAKEIMRTKYPELDWIVQDILPEGWALLGGRPKVGKSWLAMQIAQAIATNGKVFGKRVRQGKVLYLALEDNDRRLDRRMKAQHWEETDDCVYHTEWKPFNAGGLEDLDAEFKKTKYRLCIVDTVSRAFLLKDHNDIAQVTKAYDTTQRFFERHRVSLLALDHHNKSASKDGYDPIDSIIASTAKTAVPDTIIGLAKTRGKKEAVLVVRGRDAEEWEEEVVMDTLTMSWQLASIFVKPNTLQSEIVKVVLNTSIPISLTDLSVKVKKEKGQVLRECNELIKKELIADDTVRPANGMPYKVFFKKEFHA